MDYTYNQTYDFVDTKVTNATKFMAMLCNKVDINTVTEYIKMYPLELNTFIKGGVTPLMLLAKYSNDDYYYNVLEKILPFAEVDIKDTNNDTALMYAAASLNTTSSIKAVKQLVAHGADWNQSCSFNVTPLMCLGSNTSAEILMTFLDESKMDVDKRDNNNNSFATIVVQRMVSSEFDENLKNIVKSMLTRVNLYLPVNETQRSVVMMLATNDTYFDLLTAICENDIANEFSEHINDADIDGNTIMILTVKHFKSYKNICRFHEIVTRKYESAKFESVVNKNGESFKFLIEAHPNEQLKEMIYPKIKARLPFKDGCPVCRLHKLEYIVSQECGHAVCQACFVQMKQLAEGKGDFSCPTCRNYLFKNITKYKAVGELAEEVIALQKKYDEQDYDDTNETSEEELSEAESQEDESDEEEAMNE